jgi:hypothetical protein
MKNLFKNYIAYVLLAFALNFVHAQAPQKMSYQSVIRNTNGDLLANAAIGLRISIIKDSPTGTVVYSETMTNTTNENGLLSIEIGGGNPISGTFTGIDWSTGTYFVKTETDPNGGTNYNVVGTAQLLSVPYALYAKTTRNLGKTTIYLSDDITDAEAAAQINSELGPNTENIYISSTNQLTTVDLSAATTLLNVQIDNNDALTTINFNNLTKIYQTMRIISNPSLSSLSLPSLIQNPSIAEITSNAGLTSVSFLNLNKISINSLIQINNNPILTTINFDALTTMASAGQISIQSNSSLTALLFPQIQIIEQLSIQYNTSLNSINFNLVTSISGLVIEENNSINSLSFPLLTAGNFSISESNLSSLNLNLLANGDFGLIHSQLTSFSLPSLTNGSINVTGNNMLQDLHLPLLTSSVIFNINYNQQLNTIEIPNLTSIPNLNPSYYVELNNNSLPSSQVNYLLNKLTSITPTNGKNIQLKQVPPAPPTGQGLIDKQTLINNGNTVDTD